MKKCFKKPLKKNINMNVQRMQFTNLLAYKKIVNVLICHENQCITQLSIKRQIFHAFSQNIFSVRFGEKKILKYEAILVMTI